MESITPIPIMILDDRKEDVDHLTSLLKQFSGLHLMEICTSTSHLDSLIRLYTPQIVFVNTTLSGNAVFPQLDQVSRLIKLPCLVFTSSNQQDAARVFRYPVIDFLLKPIHVDELNRAITRFYDYRQQINNGKKLDALLSKLSGPRKLKFPTKNGYLFLDADDILYFKAEWNYSEAFLTNEQSEIISEGIGRVYEQLPSETYIRIGRSLIINKKYVSRVINKEKKLVLKKNGCEVVIDTNVKGLRTMDFV